MGKLLYSAAMSLDGFIAGPGGDMSWLIPYLGPNPTVDDLIDQIGALLVGHRTFRGDDPYKGTPQEGEPFGGGWSGPQFVLTHHTPSTPAPGVTFVGDLEGGLAAAQAAAGEKYVNVVGADVARQCLEAGCSTRFSCASRPCCSATACGCSTIRAGVPSRSNASA